MSENKYIIDKDSLTGIADAVRDKLGVGEATTDSQTGDIIYPEDKGYYLKEEMVAKISGFGWSKTGYSGNFARNYSPLINDEKWDEAVGEPWYSAEITLVNVSGNDSYNMQVEYSGGSQKFTTVRSSTYTVSVPKGSTYFNLYFDNKYSSSRYNGSSSLGSFTAIFKDAEGKPIRPKQSSYQYQWWDDNSVHSANFGTIGFETPIPFSIDDIQNKIINNLSGGDNAPKIALLDNFYVRGTRSSASTNLKDYGGFSNIYLIVGIFNYSYLGYLDMVNHPDKVGTYSGYDTYRFYQRYGGAEQSIMDVQHDTSNGADQFYAMNSSYGLTLSPCFIIYKEA